MGAIEFSTSSFILNVFGAYWHVLHPNCFISYWGLNDFHGRSDINALKHATQRRDFRPSSHQCWSWRPLSSLIFPPPAPFQHQCWTSYAKTAPNPFSKSTLMREGAAKSFNKSLKTFDPFLKMNIDEGGGGGGGEIVQKTLRALPQNEHWWGRGRQNRPKVSIFDSFYLLSYSAHVLFDFTAPFAKPPIPGQRAWKSTALWNVSF